MHYITDGKIIRNTFLKMLENGIASGLKAFIVDIQYQYHGGVVGSEVTMGRPTGMKFSTWPRGSTIIT